MKKLLLIMLCFMTIAACGKQGSDLQAYSNPTVEELPLADISKYANSPDTDALVRSGDFEIVNKLYEEGGDFVFYIGATFCPYCLDMFPVLFESAGEYKVPFIYIDAQSVSSETPAGEEFMKIFDKYLEYNEDNVKDLFIPFVVMVKNKKVLYNNIGTIETHDAHERGLNDDEIIKIKAKLGKAFERLLTK